MKQMFEGNGVMLFLLTSLICMKKSGNVLTNLVYHSSVGHTFALNTIVNCWMNIVTKKNFYFLIEKRKVGINIKKLCEENKLEVTNQHGHSLNT
jgi:hypothetical protein